MASPQFHEEMVRLAAENERLRAVETKYHEAVDVLSAWDKVDKAEAIARALQAEARIAALEAALQEYLDSHDFSLEASTMHKGAKCPCRDCQRARAALARPTPTPQGEQGV